MRLTLRPISGPGYRDGLYTGQWMVCFSCIALLHGSGARTSARPLSGVEAWFPSIGRHYATMELVFQAND